MASLTDFLSAPSGQPLGFQLAAMVPQARLNETAPNLQEDAGVATTRALQNYSDRQLPQMVSQSAAQGNFGSTGATKRADWLTQDTGNQVFDIQRMLGRNLANIAQQRVMATMGGMF